jgi:hypothetical protein
MMHSMLAPRIATTAMTTTRTPARHQRVRSAEETVGAGDSLPPAPAHPEVSDRRRGQRSRRSEVILKRVGRRVGRGKKGWGGGMREPPIKKLGHGMAASSKWQPESSPEGAGTMATFPPVTGESSTPTSNSSAPHRDSITRGDGSGGDGPSHLISPGSL